MLASSDGADSPMSVDEQPGAPRTAAHDGAEPGSARPQERGGQQSKQRRGARRAEERDAPHAQDNLPTDDGAQRDGDSKPQQPRKNGRASSHDASDSGARSTTISEGRDEQAGAQQCTRSDSHCHHGDLEGDEGSTRGSVGGDHSASAASAAGGDTGHATSESRLGDEVGCTGTSEESRESGAQDSAEVPVMAAELSPTGRDA